MVMRDDGICEMIDKSGKTIKPLPFEKIENYGNGLIKVRNQFGKYGIVDIIGKLVYPCKLEYIGSCYKGEPAIVKDCVSGEFKYGFLNKTGKLVIPCKWHKADIFRNGEAWVQDENGILYLIDENGSIIKKRTLLQQIIFGKKKHFDFS